MIKKEEYEQVLEYIRSQILPKTEEYADGGGGIEAAIPHYYIDEIVTRYPYEQYLQSIPKKGKVKPVVSKEVEKAFEDWWYAYPASSKFAYKGKVFQGERSLRANKAVCLKLYNDAVQEIAENRVTGVHKASELIAIDELLKALQVQLEHIKIESYKSGQNRMQYLKSAEVYLRQKAYEPWLGEEMPKEVQDNKSQIITEISI